MEQTDIQTPQTPSKWQDAATYTGVASTVAGILGTFGLVTSDQTTLIVAAVAGFAGGVIALVKLVRSFKK